MTQTQLPRRPWAQLRPPDEGLEVVRRSARARRRRRAVALGATVCSAVAGVVAAVALLGGAGDLAVLKTNIPPAGQPVPAASNAVNAPQHHAQPATGDQRAGQQGVGVAPRQPRSHGGAGVPLTNASQSNGTARDNSPQMSRYKSTPSTPAVCEAVNGDSNNNVYGTFDWCLRADTSHTADGTRLTVSVCRAATGTGSLTFGTTNEADITVQQGGKTVWDWARAHPARASKHTLTLAKNDCWNWALLWPDITQSGASAGSGKFTFVATTNAEELAHNSTASVTFTD